MVVVVFLVEEI